MELESAINNSELNTSSIKQSDHCLLAIDDSREKFHGTVPLLDERSQTTSLNSVLPDSSSGTGNKETVTILWYDWNLKTINRTSETAQMLREINDYVIFYTDQQQCIDYITLHKDEKIILITSNRCVTHILPAVHGLRQLDCVFLFCLESTTWEHLSESYWKVTGIFTDSSLLVEHITETIKLIEKQLETFSFYNQHQKSICDLSKDSAEFIWFQMFKDLVIKMPHDNDAKQQMVEYCEHYYRDNKAQLLIVKQFDETYQSNEAIRWYTKAGFVYKLVNKALRTEDIEQLHIFRLFISDLSRNLTKEHRPCNSILYRGVQVLNEEFEKFNQNIGNLISTNGFLSTSRSKDAAQIFAGVSSDTKKALLFEIECYQTTTTVIFADISRHSDFSDEQEVLFDIGATFEILSVAAESTFNNGLIWLIRLKSTNQGSEMTKEYIELNQRETEQMTAVMTFGNLLAQMGKYDQSKLYYQKLLADPKGEDLAWIYNNLCVANCYKYEFDEAIQNGQRAYDLMMQAQPESRLKDSSHVLMILGSVYDQSGQFDQALDYYMKSLKLKEEFFGPEHHDVATALMNIAIVYHEKDELDRALEYHLKSLEIKHKCLPTNHADKAASLNNISILYSEMNDIDRALDYQMQSLDMFRHCLPSDHFNIGQSLVNLAERLDDKEDYDQALQYFSQALEIFRKCFPSGQHPEIALAFSGSAAANEGQGNCDLALGYYNKASTMYEQFLPNDHPECLRIRRNISNLKQKMANHSGLT